MTERMKKAVDKAEKAYHLDPEKKKDVVEKLESILNWIEEGMESWDDKNDEVSDIYEIMEAYATACKTAEEATEKTDFDAMRTAGDIKGILITAMAAYVKGEKKDD